MTTVLLVRHGRTAANAAGILAGWTPGIHLDDMGREQAKALGERLAGLPISAVVTSPLERCRETTEILSAACESQLPVHSDLDLAECRYGDWTGRTLQSLAEEPLWPVVQQNPSTVTFPQGESMSAMQARALGSIRRWNVRYEPRGVYLAVSHGDVIKSVLADALGMHLDMFQRISIHPCSVSVITYSRHRPFVMTMNNTGGDLAGYLPAAPPNSDAPAGDAPIGGGAGSTAVR